MNQHKHWFMSHMPYFYIFVFPHQSLTLTFYPSSVKHEECLCRPPWSGKIRNFDLWFVVCVERVRENWCWALSLSVLSFLFCRMLFRALFNSLHSSATLRSAQRDEEAAERYRQRMQRWNMKHTGPSSLPVCADNPGLEPSGDEVVSWPLHSRQTQKLTLKPTTEIFCAIKC